ncbi:MAG: hypothetical protein HQL60_08070, partial [Magnetococcales bacterium]|nr:hypothetical protein [Magnetococcales bacterium]
MATTVVSSVSSSSANGYYTTGSNLLILVTFDNLVNVTGTPQITLETGTTDRTISYFSGTGTRYLYFLYTVQSGDTSSDLNYVSTSSLSLNGGTIKNGTTAATLTLPATSSASSLGGSSSIVIDTTAPTQTVTITSVTDDVGSTTGTISSGGTTDDTAPTLAGSLSASLSSDEFVAIYRDDSYLGAATTTSTTWSYSDSDLSDGSYIYAAYVIDLAGNFGTVSSSYSITVVSSPTQTVTISSISDDAGSITGTIATTGSTDDTTPTLAGSISAALGSSESVAIYRGSTKIGSATVSGTSWSYSDSGVTDGNSYSYTARVENSSGGSGTTSSAYVITIDTTAPTLTVSGVDISSDSGTSASDFWTNTTSQTITGTLSSALSTGDILYGSVDNGSSWTAITSMVSGTAISWTSATLSGTSTILFKVVDGAGNTGSTTGSQSYTVDTTAPTLTVSGVDISSDS